MEVDVLNAEIFAEDSDSDNGANKTLKDVLIMETYSESENLVESKPVKRMLLNIRHFISISNIYLLQPEVHAIENDFVVMTERKNSVYNLIFNDSDCYSCHYVILQYFMIRRFLYRLIINSQIHKKKVIMIMIKHSWIRLITSMLKTIVS